MKLGDGFDREDWLYIYKQFEEKLLFCISNKLSINRFALLFSQHFNDHDSGHTTKRVEAFFSELNTLCSHGARPCDKVSGHGVGKSAIHIKNETIVVVMKVDHIIFQRQKTEAKRQSMSDKFS